MDDKKQEIIKIWHRKLMQSHERTYKNKLQWVQIRRKSIFFLIKDTVEEEQQIAHFVTFMTILTEYNARYNYNFIKVILDQIEVVKSKLDFEKNTPKVEFIGNF